jgi:hydroxymethylglutaryl-CoA lyase
MAVENVVASVEIEVRTFDSSVSGLGGCPYAAVASGDVATEELAYLLHGLGMQTGIDLDKLAHASAWISGQLKRQPGSKVTLAMLAKCPSA